MCNKKGEVFTPRPFYNVFLFLDWRKTTSDSIIAELLHARIHTTRKAEASE
jgi:hypothetical protein